MKKKFLMRLASLALCVTFTGLLFGVPKAKAVVTETAIGTAAVASYFQATGLTMAASAGSTGALVTAGIADIAGSYAMATGAASSGSAFLSSLATGVSISPAGAIVLTAAAVVAIGALVAWYVSSNGLDDTGDFSLLSPIESDTFLYNGVEFPDFSSLLESNSTYPYALINCDSSNNFYLVFSSVLPTQSSNKYIISGKGRLYTLTDGTWGNRISFSDLIVVDKSSYLIWSNTDIVSSDGSVYFASSAPVSSSGQLEITRSPEFIQPDFELQPESQRQMVIDAGFLAGTTLDTVAEQVPDLIAAGTLAPTYTITTTETGEGTDPDPEEETGIYIPVLSEIKTAVTGLADSVVDGIMSGLQTLFVPSQAYLEALPTQITETFEERTGFLTYPFSLLPSFVDRLSATSTDWILTWPQISEPFSGAVLFQAGNYNVSQFMRSNAQFVYLYQLYRLLVKVFMSFGFLSLCYNKYRSVVGDRYGGS